MKIKTLIKKVVEEKCQGSAVDVMTDAIYRELMREVEYEVLKDAENGVSIAEDIVKVKIIDKFETLKRKLNEEQNKIEEINRFCPGLGPMNAIDILEPDFKLEGEFGKKLRTLYWSNLEEWAKHDYNFWFDKHKDEILELFKKEYGYDKDDEEVVREYIKHTDIDDVDYAYLRGYIK